MQKSALNVFPKLRNSGLLASAGGELVGFSAWWWRVLTQSVRELLELIHPNRLTRVLLIVASGRTLIKARRGTKALDDIEAPDLTELEAMTLADFWPASRPQRTAVDVALPSSRILLRRLTFPNVGERELSGIMDLNLERELPLPAEQVYVDWQIDERDRSANRLAVSIGIVRRTDVDRITSLFDRWGWQARQIGQMVPSDRSEDGPLRFDFRPTRIAARTRRVDRRRPLLLALASGLIGAVGVVTAGQWIYERVNVGPAVASAQAQIEKRDALAKRLMTDSSQASALKLTMEMRSAGEVLRDLTEALPTDAWSSDLEIRVDRSGVAQLRMVGFASNPTELVGQLEDSERFEAVQLLSATSAGLGEDTSRVEMTLKWVLPDASKEHEAGS